MALFISVVNHKHDEIITNSNTLANLANCFHVIIKSNTTPKTVLIDYCNKYHITLLTDKKIKGFGANNNEIFSFAINNLKMKNTDHFLVLNPDVDVKPKAINALLEVASLNNTNICTINLYKDINKTTYDYSIKKFPHPIAPLKSLLGQNRTDHYLKENINKPTPIDWAAGSFLLFSVNSYKKLDGFDEKYFMYFEDVDICKRANEYKYTLIYYPNIHAIHYGQFNNRNIFSKSFLFYLSSYVKYHYVQYTKSKDV